ncbi:MAG: hypothetical protein WCW52_06565 [Elusimicrobiales bacterium]|jgi:hypothetical protein
MKKLTTAIVLLGLTGGVYAENVTERHPAPPARAVELPAAKSPESRTFAAQGELPDLGSGIFIPGEDIRPGPDPQEPLTFTDPGSPLSPDMKILVGDILSLNAIHADLARVYMEMKKSWEHGITVRNDTHGCKKNELAYMYTNGHTIYLCPELINADNRNVTAQVLIHETAHIIGYLNECDATELAMTAMENAGVTPWRDGYADKCGL